jgi:hypothetical protein
MAIEMTLNQGRLVQTYKQQQHILAHHAAGYATTLSRSALTLHNSINILQLNTLLKLLSRDVTYTAASLSAYHNAVQYCFFGTLPPYPIQQQ